MTAQLDEEPVNGRIDYFGFQSTEVWTFPDGISTLTLKVMNEGDKVKFQRRTTSDLRVERGTGNASLKVDPGNERHELLRTCITDWDLVRNGVPIQFNPKALSDFLDLSNPAIIELIEKEIRKINPWLLGEMTSEDIRKEIANLEEMLKVAEEREAGEAVSSSK